MTEISPSGKAEEFLRRLFETAVRAADPMVCVPPYLPERPAGRILVTGAGKAAGAMARAVEATWGGDLQGLVITRYGHAVPTDSIVVVEASHPVPDGQGAQAGRRILEMAGELGDGDFMLCLISGGGSALMSVPAGELTLADKQRVNQQLLASGATISEMNCVRKHLSAIKGGRLAAAAYPARTLALLISDVPGDDPSTIASGPTVGDPTTLDQAREIVVRYNIDVPRRVRDWLDNPAAESPKPFDAALARSETRIVAAPKQSLAATRKLAEEEGYEVRDLGDRVEGEARKVARVHAELALAIRRGQGPVQPPAVVLSGGETTVTVTGGGRGGRNAEYALALALALDGAPGIYAIACDTDGIDGSEDNAGALVGPYTLARARRAGFDPAASLSANDAYGIFAGIGSLVITGPTLTNVNDFRAILITAPA